MSIDAGDTWVEYQLKERERVGSYMYDHQDDYVSLSRYEKVQKQNGELTDKVKELEAQIEKMKCCYNCKQSQDESYCKIKKSDVNDLSCWDCGCDKWEIKENGNIGESEVEK